jgi:drug/metabolite transporter (DMT)-like permease
MRLFLWMRIASMRAGVLTGIYLSCVFVAWLVVANRVVELEPYAELRNLVAGAILIAILAIPVLRFRHQPGKLFIAGLTAWALLTLTYIAAEIHFTLLESRMGAFHVFMLGAVSYGFVAVLDWVFLMCVVVRHQHITQSRETTASAGRHRTR